MGERDWVIRKSGMFYRSKRSGYTAHIADAGRYTRGEAECEARTEPQTISAHPVSEFLAPDSVMCPFCGERDFDHVGLKAHLVRGWCAPFENLTSVER